MARGDWEREWNRAYKDFCLKGFDNEEASRLATERLRPTLCDDHRRCFEPDVICVDDILPTSPGDLAAERIARNRAKLARFVRPWALAWMVWIALYWTVLGPQSTDLPNALGVLIASAWGGAAAVFIGRCVRALGRGRLWA
jgi:hypothetical protein